MLPRLRRTVALAGTLMLLSLAGLWAGAPAARADGDPASDVLSVERVFLPADAGVPLVQREELSGLLDQSFRAGYPLRVAVVASRADLGSVGALWRAPQTYAHFLGGELSLVFRGTVLVVMPNGYGVDVIAGPGIRTASGQAELPRPGAHLGQAAIAAVERLAASAGARLTPQVQVERTPAGPTSDLPWIAFALGFVPLGVAWTLSLRRRPLRLRS